MDKKTCNHVGLFSIEPDILIDFYVEKLGFERGESRSVPASLMRPIFGLDVECEMTKLHFGHVTVEVFAPGDVTLESRTDRTSGLNHWGLNVEDKAAYCRAAEARGAKIIRVPNRDRTIFFIEDPEGNRIEIFDK